MKMAVWVAGFIAIVLFAFWLVIQIYYATHCAMILGTRVCR